MQVRVFRSKAELGQAAANAAAEIIREAIEKTGRARVIAAAANSQIEMVDALTRSSPIDWQAVELFHMDEYLGVPADHPASFRRWIEERVASKVDPREVHYLEGDAADPEREMDRYAGLLNQSRIDLAFVGFGENGHIAFNDPAAANFHDPATVKRVTLDEACRAQQIAEGHFAEMAAVPREALTLTCPALFRARHWICCVPGTRKAAAVRRSLEGEVTTDCPASLVQRHPSAMVYLDQESAAELTGEAMVFSGR